MNTLYVGLKARGPGFEYGVDAVTPAGWTFTSAPLRSWTHSFRIPGALANDAAFLSWADRNEKRCSLSQIKLAVEVHLARNVAAQHQRNARIAAELSCL